MRNMKNEITQPYSFQNSYQSKNISNQQKNSRSNQNRSSHIYPMSQQNQSNPYGGNSYSNQKVGGLNYQYANQGNGYSSITPTGKSPSLSSALPLQHKIHSETSSPVNINSQIGGGGNNYTFNKPGYGLGNYNLIDNNLNNANDSNYLYNGLRSQSKRNSNTINGNQSASNIVGYGVLTNNTSQNTAQSILQQQISNKSNNYLMTENNQMQLPKLQSPLDGPLIPSRQMNGSMSEKNSLRQTPMIEFDSTQCSSQKKLEINSKNNLKNIVKYQNNTPSVQNNPYSSLLQSKNPANSSIENQPIVGISQSIQGRQSNTTSAVGSSSNLNQNNGSISNGNSQNSTQSYYNLSSARPPSNHKKDLSLGNQYQQYSSIGKNLNYLGSPSSSQKLTQQQQSMLSPNSKSRYQSNSEGFSKTPLKSIQPTQTGYSSIFNSNNQQSNPKLTQQNPLMYGDMLDLRMLPKIDKSKISTKQIGVVHAYGANTHQGLVRGYNEDRVSIILNMVKPPEKNNISEWPNISFFAIYDGHGGANCADFMRDQLHFFVIKDEEFPKNPQKAIHNGFVKAEDTFLKQADSGPTLDKSGSCAIVVMLINEMVYVANLGDSRAVLSQNNGQKVTGLTVDHKPNNPDEEKRIQMNGGKIYQSQIPTMQPKQYPQFIKGPHRVLPGRLAVSRTMGDAEAKLKKYGGNNKVILCEPEITSFSLASDQDFIMLGCDGIFDKLSNEQSIDFIWESMRETFRKKEMRQNIHDYIGDGIENLIKQTLIHKSFDNLTVVIICLKNLERLLFT